MGKKRRRKQSAKDSKINNNFDITKVVRNIETVVNGLGRRKSFRKTEMFTPVKCCIYVCILITLMLSGVGVFGVLIVILLLTILHLFC